MKKKKAQRVKTYWILKPEEIKALSTPIRIDIVDHLASSKLLSIKELAADIGRKPSSIYHHLKILLEVGLVVEAGSRVLNRKMEKLYCTPSRRMRLIKALGEPENHELMEDIVRGLCRQNERDFNKGLKTKNAKTEGVYRNLGFYRYITRPSNKALKEVNRLLDEIAEILWQDQNPKANLIGLSWIMTPLGAQEDKK